MKTSYSFRAIIEPDDTKGYHDFMPRLINNLCPEKEKESQGVGDFKVGSSIRNAFLVITNLFVSLAVAQVAGGVFLGIALAIIFNFNVSDLVGYAVFFLGLAATVASYLGCSWIFASRFARDDRRGHLSVVWGIPAVAIIVFLAWFIGTAPRR